MDFKETEWNPNWAEKYLYDGHIIINHIDYIIEMNGEQHYHQTGRWNFEYQKERDINKQKLAENNGVEQIIINCTKTDFYSMKNEIIKSRLSELIDLTQVNWHNIFKNCSNNYIKIASDLYNKGLIISDIANEMMFDRHTISRFLLDGKELGWCDYNPISCTELCKINVKITNMATNNYIIIHGINEAARFIFDDSGYKIDRHTIKDYCNGYRIEYYGGKHVCSLENIYYKGIYKFERLTT